jgi:hypothetical protein
MASSIELCESRARDGMIRGGEDGAVGFFRCGQARLAGLSAKGDPLEAIDRLVPWESFRADIEALTSNSCAGYSQALAVASASECDRNRSKIRARVEHVFAAQQTALGGRIVRMIGIIRARTKIGLQNLAYNIRRLVTLERIAAA